MTPGVTPKDSFQAQIDALEYSPLLNGFDHIVRTSGLITALVRPKQRRKKDLIQANGKDDELTEQVHVNLFAAKIIRASQMLPLRPQKSNSALRPVAFPTLKENKPWGVPPDSTAHPFNNTVLRKCNRKNF